MKKILLYAAVPFFLHYALLNTRDCIRKIRGQDGPILYILYILYREYIPAMKNKKPSSDRRLAQWKARQLLGD